MTKKKDKWEEYSYLRRKKGKYRSLCIAFGLWFVLALLAVIGFSIALVLFDSFIELLNLDRYALILHSFLIFLASVTSLIFVLSVRAYLSVKRKIDRFHNIISLIKKTILQVLTENKELSFTSASLLEQINSRVVLEEIGRIILTKEYEKTLRVLVNDNKIQQIVKENTLHFKIL